MIEDFCYLCEMNKHPKPSKWDQYQDPDIYTATGFFLNSSISVICEDKLYDLYHVDIFNMRTSLCRILRKLDKSQINRIEKYDNHYRVHTWYATHLLMRLNSLKDHYKNREEQIDSIRKQFQKIDMNFKEETRFHENPDGKRIEWKNFDLIV